MEPLKFGIIGCSRIAKRSVIPAILNSEFSDIEMIGSRTEEKAKEFSREFNCEKFGTYDEIIMDENVDAVYISTPIGTHEEWAIKAAESGKHVYCEKSSTVSYQSAKKMTDVCKKNNVRILEGFMFRYHPQHKKVNELIKNNRIGKPITFNGKFGFPKFPDGDIRYDKELGGGFLNDSGCYPICASRMIFGDEPIGVSCSLTIDEKTGVDVRGTSYMIFRDEKTASLTYGNGSYYQSEYEIWGTEGTISLDRAYSVPPEFQTNVRLTFDVKPSWDGKKQEKFEIQKSNHFLEMINVFCHEIKLKEDSRMDFEIELENQAKVMEAHRISSQEKRFVNIDEIN